MVQVPAEFAAEISDADCNYTITVMRRNNILQLENVQNKIFSDRRQSARRAGGRDYLFVMRVRRTF